MKVDLFKFFRNIRLREFFKENDKQVTECGDTDTTEKKVFKNKSTFVPPINRNNSIETYCRLVEQDVDKYLKEKQRLQYKNLTKEERNALKDLKEDESIVIKSADKGGATVVMNKTDYVQECLRQLADKMFYEEIPQDPTQRFKNIIFETIDELFEKGDISRKEHDFLRIEHPVIPTFYTLPKIHKNLDQPPGRPIVASIGSITSNLSTYVDHFIRPLTEALPSFTKDTGHIVNIIESINSLGDEEMYLVSFDINAMYTSIPHDGGMEALDHYLLDSMCNPSKTCILELSKLILRHNYWVFQNTFYIQRHGVPMGSSFSPSFSNLYMGLFEENYIYSNHIFKDNIFIWKRYLDDIFCLFKGSVTELTDFFAYLNSCSEFISFSMDYNDTKLSFLDLWIIRDGEKLYTDLYTKPTARNCLLRADSDHPLPLKNSLPFSQFCRLKRICKKPEDLNKNMTTMKNNFTKRGYKNSVLNEAANKINDIPRTDLLKDKPKKKSNRRVILTTEYCRNGGQFKNIIMKHWHILESDDQLKNVFNERPLIVYKRGRNLRDQLVHSYLSPDPVVSQTILAPIPDGNRRCGNCAQCNYTYRCNSFKHPHTGKEIKIKGKISCSTTFVIYLITCPCGKSYVGKTSRSLKTRIAEHRSTIRCKNLNYPVAAHFVEFNHPISSLKYIGIEKVVLPPRGGDLDNLLSRREHYWIYHLKTLTPYGLNVEYDLKCFL